MAGGAQAQVARGCGDSRGGVGGVHAPSSRTLSLGGADVSLPRVDGILRFQQWSRHPNRDVRQGDHRRPAKAFCLPVTNADRRTARAFRRGLQEGARESQEAQASRGSVEAILRKQLQLQLQLQLKLQLHPRTPTAATAAKEREPIDPLQQPRAS